LTDPRQDGGQEYVGHLTLPYVTHETLVRTLRRQDVEDLIPESPNKPIGRDAKTGAIANRFCPFTTTPPNVSAEGVFYRSQESHEFALAPLSQQFDASIRQVSDFSSDLEIRG
jgi:hypothetical protein